MTAHCCVKVFNPTWENSLAGTKLGALLHGASAIVVSGQPHALSRHHQARGAARYGIGTFAKAGRIGTSPLQAGLGVKLMVYRTSPQLADAGGGVDVKAIRLPRGVLPYILILNLAYVRPLPL